MSVRLIYCLGYKDMIKNMVTEKVSFWQNIHLVSPAYKRQPHKMVKHIQTIRWQQPTNCLSVFEHFVRLTLKGLRKHPTPPPHPPALINLKLTYF